MLELLSQDKGTDIKQAIKIWLGDSVGLKKDFLSTLNSTYKAELQKVAFSDVEKTVQIINDWVSNSTNGVIKKLVNSGNYHPHSIQTSKLEFFYS